MNYFHILTLLFVVGKLFELVTWSWWVVFAPSIVSIAITMIIFIGALYLAYRGTK